MIETLLKETNLNLVLIGNPHEIDECQLMPGMCQNGVCVNTIGSFHCTCYPGYVYDETSHQCIDENECTQSLGKMRFKNCEILDQNFLRLLPNFYPLSYDRWKSLSRYCQVY